MANVRKQLDIAALVKQDYEGKGNGPILETEIIESSINLIKSNLNRSDSHWPDVGSEAEPEPKDEATEALDTSDHRWEEDGSDPPWLDLQRIFACNWVNRSTSENLRCCCCNPDPRNRSPDCWIWCPRNDQTRFVLNRFQNYGFMVWDRLRPL